MATFLYMNDKRLVCPLTVGLTLALHTFPVGASWPDIHARQAGDDQHGDSDSDSDTDSDSDGPGNSNRSSSSRSRGPTTTTGPTTRAPDSTASAVTIHGGHSSSTRSGSAQATGTGSGGKGGGRLGTGGIVGIIVALLVVLIMASFIFFAWRRRVRHQRSMPRGTFLLPGSSHDSSNGSSPNPNTYNNTQPEMASRNNLLSSIPTDSATMGATTDRSRSIASSHHQYSSLSGNSLLLPPLPSVLPSPHEEYNHAPSSIQNNNTLPHDTLSAATPTVSNNQPYTYEESQRHSTLSSSISSTVFPAGATSALANLSQGIDGQDVGTSRRTSQLHRDMAAFQKQLEAEDEQAMSQGKASQGSTHPSGDALVAIVDPPPSYSRAES